MISDDTLWLFQRYAVGRGVAFRRHLFCHQTGLGKTVMILATVERLVEIDKCKILIVGKKNSLATWLRLCKQWWDVDPTLIAGTSTVRLKQWSELRSGTSGVWLCTYDVLWRDQKWYNPEKLGLKVLILDEVQKIRNSRTKAYGGVSAFAKVPIILGGSATLVSRGPQDLWGVLNILDRGMFSSYWRFVNKHCYVIDGPYGKEIGPVKNPAELHSVLDRYITRDTWANVAPQIPPIRRELVTLEMSPEQKALYKELEKEWMAETESQFLLVNSPLALLTRLRQITVSPLLVGARDAGAIVEYLVDEIEDNPHTVIFTPFAKLLDPLQNILEKGGMNGRVFQLRGGTSPEEINRRVAEWKRSEGVMLCTIAFAESFALDTVRVAYMAGFEWAPDMQEQAEGRLKRMDTAKFEGVLVKYLSCKGTVDYGVISTLDLKADNIAQTWPKPRIETHDDVRKLIAAGGNK